MNEIENYLKTLLGDFSKKISPINDSTKHTFFYYKNLNFCENIQMVIKSPFIYDKCVDTFILLENSVFIFFLYDLETDMIFGELQEIDFDENWEEELSFNIYDVENKLQKYICPLCQFWLVQRTNKYGHHFLGCADYPECTFNCKLDNLSI